MTKIIMLGCNGRMGQMITDMVKQDDECTIVAGIDIVDNRAPGSYGPCRGCCRPGSRIRPGT